MFEPEPEPGDRWRWAVLFVLVVAVFRVLRSHAIRPVAQLVMVAVGIVVLTIVIAGLVRLLR